MVTVNSSPIGPDDRLADVRERALRATDVSIIIAEAGPGTPVVWVNDGFTRSTGYRLDEVRGQSLSTLHGPGADGPAAGLIGAAVAHGESRTATVLSRRKDGTSFWSQVTVSPVTDDEGRLTHLVAVQVDVTDRVAHSTGLEESALAERRAREGLAVVSQVSDLMADLDAPYILREIAALLRREVVDWAAFYVEENGLRPASGIAADVQESTSSRRHTAHVPDEDGPRERQDVVQHLLDGVRESPLELSLVEEPTGRTTRWLVEHVRAALAGHGGDPRHVVVHAMPGRRRNLGLLVTVPPGGGGLGSLDASVRTVLHLVVRRVGMGVDNLRLYAREHRLAETLQRAMLPEQAEVKDLDVWTYYSPSSGHAQVGGDWYDVLQLDPDHVTLVIGDVVGHDVEAAAAMGQLRSVVRSYVYESRDPGEVLGKVDQLVAGMRIPRSASMALVMLRRAADGWDVRYSRAGHLPPLVGRGDEVVQLADATGSMIGFGSAARSTGSHHLRPGDVMVLYTDGLIERRDRRLRDGLAALVQTVADLGPQDAAGVGEELLSRLADEPEDDVAVVVVRVPDPASDGAVGSSSPRRRRWSLPSEPASIGRARQAVLRTCAAWEIPGASSAELVVSELVANAVLHGWGHVVLRLFDTGDGLRIEVEDANPAPPVTTDGHPGRVGGYGMRIVERLADWGWRPSGSGKLVWARVRPLPISASVHERPPTSQSPSPGPGPGRA